MTRPFSGTRVYSLRRCCVEVIALSTDSLEERGSRVTPGREGRGGEAWRTC